MNEIKKLFIEYEDLKFKRDGLDVQINRVFEKIKDLSK